MLPLPFWGNQSKASSFLLTMNALGVARAMKLIVTALTAIAIWAIYVGVWERRIEREPSVMQPANFEQQEYLKYLESIGDRECY